MFRPTFLAHRGRRILRIDYSGMPLPEAVLAMQKSTKVIEAEPPGSVLCVTLWDTPLSREGFELIRRHVLQNTPYIRASAVVTPRPIQRVIFDSIKVNGRERLKVFDDERQAMDWLTCR